VQTWWSAAATRAAQRGVRGHASLEAADGNNLIPGPDSVGEGARSAAQDGVGAIVEWLKGWDDAARQTQMRRVERSSAGSSLGSLALGLCLGKETAGTWKVFEKCLIIASTEIFLFCKNSLGNTMEAPKTASAGERPVSSLGCARIPRSTKGNSSDQVAAAARARRASLRRWCSLSTASFDSGW
jgi:hypothetical protein